MQQLVVLKKIKKYICEEEILGNKVSSLQLQASFCIFHIETTIFYLSRPYQKSFREPYISKGPNFKSEVMHVHFITLPSCTTIFLKLFIQKVLQLFINKSSQSSFCSTKSLFYDLS